MSRHRRQASQVLPPEIIAGDEAAKPFDLSQVSSGSVSAGRTTTQDTKEEIKETPLTNSPTAAKKPPAGKST